MSPPMSALPQGPFRRIQIGLLFFGITLVMAVLGYTWAGWNLLDAIYMVVITIFGVGYGEVRPLDDSRLKVFTILVIIAGTSASVYAVGGFVQLIAEGEIKRALGTRRMSQGIENLEQHVIVCGFGRIGQVLARELRHNRKPFVVIDSNPDRVAQAEALGYWVRMGDATEEDVLEAVGIRRAQVLATVLRSDAANVFITLTGRSLNPQLSILARGESGSTERKLLQAGADHVVLPAAIGGIRMAHLITHPAVEDLLDQAMSRNLLTEQLAQIDIQLVDVQVPPGSPLVGQSLGYLEVRGKRSFLIVALRRNTGQTFSNPDPALKLESGDTVIALGHKDDIPQFAQRYQTQRPTTYRGAQA